MAYNLKYFNEFTSRHFKRLVRVEILERDYAGSSEQIKMGATISLSNSGDGREEPIKKLTASLRLLSERNFQFEHLFTADDRKYLVKIERNGQTIFRGFLESDSYSEPYYSWKNYTVNLTARDNLGRLEDIPYLDINGDRVTGLESASDIIDRALLNTGYQLLKSNKIGIKSSDMGAGSTLSQTYINNDAFWNFEDNEPLSCLDVITNIIQGFGSQLRQISNTWQIVDQASFYDQPTVQGNSASFPSYLADRLNFPLVEKAFKWINRDAEMTVLPAWKGFVIDQLMNRKKSFCTSMPEYTDYNDSGLVNSDGDILYTINGWSTVPIIDLGGGIGTGGFVRDPNDPALIIPNGSPSNVNTSINVPIITSSVKYLFRFFAGEPAYDGIMTIVITIGDQILVKDGWKTVEPGDVGIEFTTTKSSNSTDYREFTVFSDGVPISGLLNIQITGYTSFYEYPLRLRNLDVSIVSDNPAGSLPNIQTIKSTINDNNNISESFDLNIGQVPNIGNASLAYDNGLFTSAGVAQVDWKREGDTTAENLLKKVAIGYDLQNRQPARQVNGTVIWDWDLWTNIDDQNKRLMINSADWDMNTDEMSAEFVEVFEYKNTVGGFDDGFDDGLDNSDAADYKTNTTFTLTEKTE